METAKVTIIVPKWATINGKRVPFGDSTRQQFEQMLLRNAGGFTLLETKGAWLDNANNRVDDASLTYTMYCANNPSILANLKAQAKFIKDNLKQDAVLFSVESVTSLVFV